MYVVYILKSEQDGSYYVGHTSDLEKRLWHHNSKLNRGWTKKKQPWRVVYTERYPSRGEAIKREQEIKSWGINYRKKLVGDVV